MVKNFLFHRVNKERDILWDPMDVSLFEKCISFISKNYSIALIEDLVHNKNQLNPTKKYASIVFDDGYKDNIEYALPILEKYKVKASFYIVTDCIDKNIPTWTYILDYLFQNTSKEYIKVDFDFLPSQFNISQLKTKEERITYARKLKPFLKTLNNEHRQQVLNVINKFFDDVNIPEIMMSWDDLQQIKSAGYNVGSHTVTHNMLGTMNDEQEIINELVVSKNIIYNKLGFFPETISYPVGSYNSNIIKLAGEAGYKIGLVVDQTSYQPHIHIDLAVPRIELYNESWIKTRCRMNDVYRKIINILKPS